MNAKKKEYGTDKKNGEKEGRHTIEGLTTGGTEATGGTVEFFDFGGELLHEFAHVKLLLADHVLGNFWKKMDRKSSKRMKIENSLSVISDFSASSTSSTSSSSLQRIFS